MSAYLINRRYKNCLPKSHLPDGRLNSVPITKCCGILVEGRDPCWSLGQQRTCSLKEGRWKGLCQGQ